MKNVIKSLFIIVAVVAVAGGATYSYFSDTETVAGNTLSAGTLDLKTNNADGVTKAYSLNNLKPGAWDLAGQVILKNDGSIKGHAWLEIKNVVNSGPSSGNLGDFVKASFQQNVAPWTRYGGTESIDASEGVKVDLFDLDAGASMPLVLYAVWPSTDNDNTVQGNNIQFDVVFHLDQVH